MTKHPRDLSIPNFSFFGIRGEVFLDVFSVEVDEQVYYNPAITIFLDDNREHEMKALTLNMSNFICDEETLEQMIIDVAERMSHLFPEISDVVTVYDIDGEEATELSLNELFGAKETTH